MIDIHTHILPNLDDGPDSVEESFSIINMAYLHGTKGMIFTPHFLVGSFINNRDIVKSQYNQFVIKAKDLFPDMEFFYGSETMISPHMLNHLRNKEICTLNDTSYILLELPFINYRTWIDDVIDSIIKMGFNVIIAHPERCEALYKNIEIVERIAGESVYFQINAGSFLGIYGKTVKSFADFLLEKGRVSFIASDAHSTRTRNAVMQPAYEYVSRLKGEAFAKKIFVENPGKMLGDEKINI